MRHLRWVFAHPNRWIAELNGLDSSGGVGGIIGRAGVSCRIIGAVRGALLGPKGPQIKGTGLRVGFLDWLLDWLDYHFWTGIRLLDWDRGSGLGFGCLVVMLGVWSGMQGS